MFKFSAGPDGLFTGLRRSVFSSSEEIFLLFGAVITRSHYKGTTWEKGESCVSIRFMIFPCDSLGILICKSIFYLIFASQIKKTDIWKRIMNS